MAIPAGAVDYSQGNEASARTETMGVFYGWIIVAVGIVVTCIGLGSSASHAGHRRARARATAQTASAVAIAQPMT